jgi:hypothetical protein
MRSPTARTLQWLRKEGFTAESTEKWIPVPKHPGGGIRRDLFGCIDIVAIQGCKLLGIQSTSGGNHNARVLKAMAEPKLAEWLATGALFEVWSWTKKGARGKRKTWQVRVEQLHRFENGAVYRA